jgi:para-nitrobenzyl esterase
MTRRALITLSAAILLAPSLAFAQAPPPDTEVGLASSALVTLPAKGGAKLTVTSPAFKQMGDIPYENTQYRTNTFPGLEWTAGPAGTKSYAVIMQDTDGMIRNAPILHWTMFNIPGTKLDAGMAAVPSGATYGPNMRGANQAYMGPRTPAGPKHRYHLQVFALDTTLAADAGASLDTLQAAMKDHVLASGEVVGLGSVDPDDPAPGRRGGAPAGAPRPARDGKRTAGLPPSLKRRRTGKPCATSTRTKRYARQSFLRRQRRATGSPP